MAIYWNDGTSLYHYGIKGQRWGERRFQNPDGSLTAEGRRRYLKDAYRDMDSHFRSQISKQAAKVTAIGRNGYDNRGSAWTTAYRKGLVTGKDVNEIKSAASNTRAYMKAKYGEDVVKALARSGVLGRPVDDFKVSSEEVDKFMSRHFKNYVPKNTKQHDVSTNTISKRPNLTDRFNAAKKDNPKLTYSQIYKEMKVNMNSEDPDDYKDAEAAWLKKHGY